MKSAQALLSVALLTACGTAEEPVEVGGDSIARAQLAGPDGTPHGEVIVAQGDGKLILRIDAIGLPPGAKGVHIHAVGQCEGPDFASAGGHWNPEGRQHGFDNPDGAHKGDFVNLDIGPDGMGLLESTIDGTSLIDGPNPLLDADGAAFVVHQRPDDLATDPSGNSGARIACGVFALQKYTASE